MKYRLSPLLLIVLLSLALTACGTRGVVRPEAPYQEIGLASYYHGKMQGKRTASGERYNEHEMTAAHAHLPLGTVLSVVNMKNGHSVEVRVNDRCAKKKRRIIDLSYSAAKKLGMLHDGLARVKITAIQ